MWNGGSVTREEFLLFIFLYLKEVNHVNVLLNQNLKSSF